MGISNFEFLRFRRFKRIHCLDGNYGGYLMKTLFNLIETNNGRMLFDEPNEHELSPLIGGEYLG